MKPTPNLTLLEESLSVVFIDKDFLKRALTHKSYVHETKHADFEDNERLEFLGDAVLDLIISEALIVRFPKMAEGELSKMKARIVSEPTLASVSGGISLGQYLFLGKGEEKTEGRGKRSLLSDALEALIAAIFLDQGFSTAREVVLKLFNLHIEELTRQNMLSDYKTALQELCQKEFETLPIYRLASESGPDHQKMFEVIIEIHATCYGRGMGRSKKEAEQRAAQAALAGWHKDPQ